MLKFYDPLAEFGSTGFQYLLIAPQIHLLKQPPLKKTLSISFFVSNLIKSTFNELSHQLPKYHKQWRYRFPKHLPQQTSITAFETVKIRLLSRAINKLKICSSPADAATNLTQSTFLRLCLQALDTFLLVRLN